MKPRFTLFQKIMTTIFIVLQTAVMISDIIRLATAEGEAVGSYYYAVNLVLCAGLLAVFLVLIFKPSLCVSTEETYGEQQLEALISASRTYMCFIAVDISLIFAFVMFLSKRVQHPALCMIIGGVVIFIAGAVKYIYDSQNFIVEEQPESEEISEENADGTAQDNPVEDPEEKSEKSADEESAKAEPESSEEENADAQTADGTEEATAEDAPEEEPEEEEQSEEPEEEEKSEEEKSVEEPSEEVPAEENKAAGDGEQSSDAQEETAPTEGEEQTEEGNKE